MNKLLIILKVIGIICFLQDIALAEGYPQKEFIEKLLDKRDGYDKSDTPPPPPMYSVDLNDDNLKDFFIPWGCGVHFMCSCVVLVQNESGSFEDYGDVGCQEGGTILLYSKHNGFHDILTYNRFGISSGLLIRSEVNAKTYKEIASQYVEDKESDMRNIWKVINGTNIQDSIEQSNPAEQQAAR